MLQHSEHRSCPAFVNIEVVQKETCKKNKRKLKFIFSVLAHSVSIHEVAIVTLSRSTEKKGGAGGEAIPWRRQQLTRDCWLALFC